MKENWKQETSRPLLTALNATSDVVQKAGANDFISKPFHKEELLIRVPIDLADRRQADHHPANRRAAAHDIGTG
ncbi:MAG: hypothetical protein ACLUEV_03715 [Alistipes sp.]